MVLDAFFRRASETFPIPVMLRALLERVFEPARLNDWFEAVTEKQYTRELLFSSAFELIECGGLQSLWECPCRVSGEADGGGDHGLRHVGVQQAQRRGGPDLPGVGARHRGAPPPPRRGRAGGLSPVAAGLSGESPGWELHCSDGASPAGVAHHRRGTAARQGAGGLCPGGGDGDRCLPVRRRARTRTGPVGRGGADGPSGRSLDHGSQFLRPCVPGRHRSPRRHIPVPLPQRPAGDRAGAGAVRGVDRDRESV